MGEHSSKSNIVDQKAPLAPFLKWAGGKRWLTQRHMRYFPLSFRRYHEPFFGGGALYFWLRPDSAVLSDVNGDLINVYVQVRDRWEVIAAGLEEHQRLHNKEHYYAIRALEPLDPVDRAVRFIYLNRTCWNGLYRVNKAGKFNVPIGTKDVVLMADDFEEISRSLKKAKLLQSDFESTIDGAVTGDLVYADPPYTVKHNNNGFVKYNENIFSWEDQVRLAGAASRAAARGVKVIVSNADHESVRELYSDFGEIIKIDRASVIAGNSAARGSVGEVLIRCY